VERNPGIAGDENQSFDLRLSDQESIEWVTMMRRKVARLLRVVEVQR